MTQVDSIRTRILGGNFLAVPSNKLILPEVAMSRNGVGLASLEILQETRRLRLWSSVLRPRQPNFVPWESTIQF